MALDDRVHELTLVDEVMVELRLARGGRASHVVETDLAELIVQSLNIDWVKPEAIDPNEPGSQGAIAFARFMGIFRDIEQSGLGLHYPLETTTELVWMSLHGLVAAIINNPEFPWTKRDALIEGMLDMVVRGAVKMP